MSSGSVQAAEVSLEYATIIDAFQAAISAELLRSHASVVYTQSATYPVCTPGVVIEESSYNWFGDRSCALRGVGDQQRLAAFSLQPLDETETVPTHVPAPGSVLIKAVPVGDACWHPVDARGAFRGRRAPVATLARWKWHGKTWSMPESNRGAPVVTPSSRHRPYSA
ncbi:MAG TPA: hypothetical protein VI072_24075 [Polyangiaceae bacterium]